MTAIRLPASSWYAWRISSVLVGLLIALPGLAADSIDAAAEGIGAIRTAGCLDCHSVGDTGGSLASDLATRPIEGRMTPINVATTIWNHAPEMLRTSEEAGIEWKPLDQSSARDVLAYFWSRRYFDVPGDVRHGEAALTEKGCFSCHERDAGTGGQARSLDTAAMDTVVWISRLWNHGVPMQEALTDRGLPWPELSEAEMSDIILYLQTSRENVKSARTLELSGAEEGARLLDEKGCRQCHTLGGSAPDLTLPTETPRTMIGFAVGIWNHRSEMGRAAASQRIELPTIEPEDARSILAYIVESGGFAERGNPRRGAKTFRRRGCAGCHSTEENPLPEIGLGDGAAEMIAATWRHGASMREELDGAGDEWPRLSAREMRDLVAFLADAREEAVQ